MPCAATRCNWWGPGRHGPGNNVFAYITGKGSGNQRLRRARCSACRDRLSKAEVPEYDAALRAAAQHRLAKTPFSFRKASRNPAQREFSIPFGGTGYVALPEIVSMSKVVVLAGRHQREEDDH